MRQGMRLALTEVHPVNVRESQPEDRCDLELKLVITCRAEGREPSSTGLCSTLATFLAANFAASFLVSFAAFCTVFFAACFPAVLISQPVSLQS